MEQASSQVQSRCVRGTFSGGKAKGGHIGATNGRAARRKPAGGKDYRRAHAAPLATNLSAPSILLLAFLRKSP